MGFSNRLALLFLRAVCNGISLSAQPAEGILCYNSHAMKHTIIERRGRIEELDRSFDLQFWQSQSPRPDFKLPGSWWSTPAR